MINDLNKSLENLIKTHPIIVSDQVPVLFDVPSREWSSSHKKAVNFHLYDIRENLERRDTQRPQSEVDDNGKVKLTDGKVKFGPRPVRLSLSYLVTCWAQNSEDEYKLLWSVLQTLTAHSPIETEFLEGDLKKLGRKVPTQVAQPDGVLQNISEFWATLGNQIRPSVSLVATLELPVELKPTHSEAYTNPVPVTKKPEINLRPGTVALRIRVLDEKRTPVSDAEVVLKAKGPNTRSVDLAAPPDASDGYVVRFIPTGTYTIHVEPRDKNKQPPPDQDITFSEDASGTEQVREFTLS